MITGSPDTTDTAHRRGSPAGTSRPFLCARLLGTGRRLRRLDTVQVTIGSQNQSVTDHGGRGHRSLVEVVFRQHLEFGPGRKNGRLAVLIEQVQPSCGSDRRGGKVAPHPGLPDLLAGRRLKAGRHTAIVDRVQVVADDQRRGLRGHRLLHDPADVRIRHIPPSGSGRPRESRTG